MAQYPERRHLARVTIPSQFSGHGLALQPVRLVELSLRGARIEHPDPLNVGLLCFVDLPSGLGRGTLSGRIVWSKLHRDEQTLEGARQRYYRSGLTWTGLTPVQQGALTGALAILTAAQAVSPPEQPAETSQEGPPERGEPPTSRA